MSYITKIPGDTRFAVLPITRPAIWEAYKTSVRCFWTVEEVDTSKDRSDYNKLSEGGKHAVKVILGMFASFDRLVNINIVERFKSDVGIYEADIFYDFQVMMENIHGEMYSLLLDAIIEDIDEKNMLFDAINQMPVIKKMSQYVFDCTSSDKSFPERLLRMACVEGIFFSGCFCVIYWYMSKGLMAGLGHSNELIARDEGMHTMFALMLYTMGETSQKLSNDEVHAIFSDATNIAVEFIGEILKFDLEGMNSRLMTQYIQSVADNLLTHINTPKLFNVAQPFGFMEQLGFDNRTNFFEKRVSEYSKKADVEDGYAVEDDF